MRKQQREITNHQWEIPKQREFQNNAIDEVKQISISHVIIKVMTTRKSTLQYNFVKMKVC